MQSGKLVLSCLLIPLWLLSLAAFGQGGALLSGYVKSESVVAIPGATVALKNTAYGTTCDANGFYSFATLKPGNYTISSSAIGYLPVFKEITIKYRQAQTANFSLRENPQNLNEVSVFGKTEDQTLVIFGVGDNGGKDEGRYAVIKVADMTVTTGKLALQAFPTGFSTYSMGFAEYRAGKLFLGYSFGSNDWSLYPNMPVYQQLNVAVIDYSTMAVESNISDIRSTNPGGPTVYAPATFQDENGDIYFMTDPVYNYDYKSPSAVYRIKSGTTTLDQSYYFDFSSKVNKEMGAAMWYIGNGKAIVRTRVAGESIDADHSFSVIDVKTGAFVKKLALPVDKGERMVQAVVVENGKAYIAVNAADKDYIWEYDPVADKLTQGAEFVGGINYILRLEKTK